MNTQAITATRSRLAWRVLLVCLVAAGCLIPSARLAPVEFWHGAATIGAILLSALALLAIIALWCMGYTNEMRAPDPWFLLARWGMVPMPFATLASLELAILLIDEQKSEFSMAVFGIAGVFAAPMVAGALWGVLAHRTPPSDESS